MHDLSSKSEQATKGARDMTTDALGGLETYIRGQQTPSSKEEEPPSTPLPTKKDKS